LNVLLYGSRITGSRIRLVFDPGEIEIIYYTQKISKPSDLRSLRKLRDIDLAIVDATEIGAKQACNYLAKVRRIAVALLVNEEHRDWDEWKDYPVFAYIPGASGDQELAARIKSVISRRRSPGKTAEGSDSKKKVVFNYGLSTY